MSVQRKIRVAVVFGGKGPEHAVSCMGGGNMLGAIDRDRYEVIPVGITREGNWVLAADEPGRLAISGGELPSVEAVAEPGAQVVPWADQSAPALRGGLGQRPRRRSRTCSARSTWCCLCCTARSARTAPSRACWRWPASATWGRACWPARSAWTRST